MKLKKVIWIVIGLLILALIAWPKLFPSQKKDGAGKQGGKGAPVKVSVYPAKEQISSESIQVSGNILATEEVELRSETQGRVVKIAFDEGTEVTKGQLLVKINDADLIAQLKKAIATQKLKTDTEKRNKSLLDKGAISQEVYDLSLSELNGINADVDLIKEQIRKTEIHAPFTGMIGLRYISEGSYVTNATQIASLHTLNQVKVEFAVPEKYATRLHKGNEITFTIDGNDKVFKAKIFAIEPQVNAATRNVVMRAICDNSNRILIPGAFANVNVELGTNKNVLMIPTQAVVPVLKGQKVFIIVGDSAVERMIKVGTRGDLLIEVKEGLHVNEQVIVNGVMYVRPGSKVVISNH